MLKWSKASCVAILAISFLALPQNKFLRVHRSFIVNLNKTDSYTKEFIEIGKNAIPISRTYKENVLKKLAEI
jgi:DNA-binding LytR/AlgR family response regulator